MPRADSSRLPSFPEAYNIENDRVGRIVGKKGVRIKQLMKDLNVEISIKRTVHVDKSDGSFYKIAHIAGPSKNVQKTIRAFDQILGIRKKKSPKKDVVVLKTHVDTPIKPIDKQEKIIDITTENHVTESPIQNLKTWLESTSAVLGRPKSIEPLNFEDDLSPIKTPSEDDEHAEPSQNQLERYKSLLRIMMDECLLSESLDNFIDEFKREISPQHRWIAIHELLMFGLERNEKCRSTVTDVVLTMLKANDVTLLTIAQFKAAIRRYLQRYSYHEIDYPKIAIYTAHYFNKWIFDNYLTFGDIQQYSVELVKDGHGGKYLAEQIKMLKNVYGSDKASEIWAASGLTFKSFLSPKEDLHNFVKSNGLEFVFILLTTNAKE